MTQDNSEQTHQSPHHTAHPVLYKLLISCLATITISVIIAVLYTHFYVKQALHQTYLATQQLHQQQLAIQNNFQATHHDLQKIMEERLSAFEVTLNRARKEQHYQTSDWLMLKARYYLELASFNNIWTNDNQTTSALLKEADTLLSNLNNEKITEVRKAIAAEQTAIEAIPPLDITGILSTLNALQQTVDTLNLVHEPKPENKLTQTSDTANNLPKTWRYQLHQTLKTLQSLVVIRHHDDLTSAYMTPTDVIIQRDVIRLNLQEAQSAVLQRQTFIYQLMLSQAIENASRTFDPSDGKTVAFVHQIKQLKTINLTAHKPSLEDALSRLDQLIQIQSNQEIPVSVKKQETSGG